MRSFTSVAAIVLVASFVRFEGVSFSPLAYGQDRVPGIISAARKALGGEDKVAGLKTLTAEGPFRRSMGGREMDGTLVVTLARPDKMHRVEDMAMGGMVGGPTIERTMVLNGTTAWEDTQNRGGMGGGGMRIVMAGPGQGPGGAGGMTPEQMNEARVRRMRVQMLRLTAALIADAGTPWVDAGIAESPEGKADILETKEETGRTLRLFIDQGTKLPLMVQYQDPKPMVMINGGPGRGPGGPGGPGGPPGGGEVRAVPGGPGAPGGPPPQMTPEEMQKRIEEMRKNPPALGTYALHLSDFKKVDGIVLPHRIETSLDGEPNEEWTIEKFKVNPTIKSDIWEKK
jgi:hypothetical protein